MQTDKLPEDVFLKTATVKLVAKDGAQIDEFSMRCGTNLWVFIRKRGQPIGSACSGVGVCAACHVEQVSGETNALSEQSDFEREQLARHGLPTSSRLACLCRVFGDVTVKATYW